jgi:hypothetical protein
MIEGVKMLTAEAVERNGTACERRKGGTREGTRAWVCRWVLCGRSVTTGAM